MIGPMTGRVLAIMLSALALGCGSDDPLEALSADGELVTPPFEVRGEAEGLLLVWFDGEGLHTASRRGEIPAERREMVRVDDLGAAPEDRLDPELVYVADLRRAGANGGYPVRRMPRATFDARVAAATEVAHEEGEAQLAEADPGPAGDPGVGGSEGGDVIIYGASWCGACRSAASFLRQRQIAFVERDVEREPGAREAMLRSARAVGLSPSGIPVIDFRGQIIQGFDQAALERAIAASRTPI